MKFEGSANDIKGQQEKLRFKKLVKKLLDYD